MDHHSQKAQVDNNLLKLLIFLVSIGFACLICDNSMQVINNREGISQ